MFLSEQQSPATQTVSLKHQLLQVIVRVAQYRLILTGETRLLQGFSLKSRHFRRISSSLSLLPLADYLNNLSPDSKEYEDTQGIINTPHKQRAPVVLLGYRGFTYLCSLRYSEEEQFRSFLFVSLTHLNGFQLCSVCVFYDEKHFLFLGRQQISPRLLHVSALLTYFVFFNRNTEHRLLHVWIDRSSHWGAIIIITIIRNVFLSFSAAVAAVSEIADQANDSLKDGVSVGLSGSALSPTGVLNWKDWLMEFCSQ